MLQENDNSDSPYQPLNGDPKLNKLKKISLDSKKNPQKRQNKNFDEKFTQLSLSSQDIKAINQYAADRLPALRTQEKLYYNGYSSYSRMRMISNYD